MIGYIPLKRTIQRASGSAAALLGTARRTSSQPTACILVYHRVAELAVIDTRVDDWNVMPALFEKHVAALADSAEIVALQDLPAKLRGGHPTGKPLVCLTFDDGYASFHANVLPILKRYHAPATAFVVTSSIGGTEPLSFDGWSQRNRLRVPPDAWRPMDWAELEDCVSSGLVTIGAHSHRHLKGRESTAAELAEEVQESRAVLRARFGEGHVQAYSYPYGSTRLGYVPPSYVNAVKASGFELAVTTDLGLVEPDCNWYLLPRIEALGVDSPRTVRAKVSGSLAPLYLTDRLRMAKRAL